MQKKIRKTAAQWREQLDREQYVIAREGATEAAFSGKYHDHHAPGRYRCVCCGQILFSSVQKFDSGSGWPSFQAPISEEAILHIPDHSHGMLRTEVKCTGCDAHLGHVFSDGPPPGGLRYCINSATLDFEAD